LPGGFVLRGMFVIAETIMLHRVTKTECDFLFV
jgi:hypothetical protein